MLNTFITVQMTLLYLVSKKYNIYNTVTKSCVYKYM